MILEIPDAPSLPEIPLEITVPPLNVQIPEAHLDWAYQAYTALLLDTIEAQLEGVPEELDNFWSIWENEQARIWSSRFDLISAMGYANVLATSKAKELAYQRSLYSAARQVFSEAIRAKNLKLYIGARVDIEKQRQAHDSDRKTLELAHAKSVIANSVEGYNLARSYFAAQVAEVAAQQKRVNAVIAQNALRVKLYEELVKVEEAKVGNNRALVEARRAEVRIQQALLEVADAQLEAQRTNLKVDALMIEITRQQIEAFIVGTQEIAETARQADIVADIALISAQSDELRVYQSDLAETAQQLAIIRATAAEKITAFNRLVDEKTIILNELTTAQIEELTAEEQYVNAQIEAAEAGIQVEQVTGDTRISNIEANGLADLQGIQADDESGRFSDKLESFTEALRLSKVITEYLAMYDKAEAKSKVAQILKDAKIINDFTEYNVG